MEACSLFSKDHVHLEKLQTRLLDLAICKIFLHSCQQVLKQIQSIKRGICTTTLPSAQQNGKRAVELIKMVNTIVYEAIV